MSKWKFAAMVIASLCVCVLRHATALADAIPYTLNNSNDAPLSYTVQTSSEGIPVWVTIVPQGHTISAETLKGQPWWKWGNTLSDIYLFAIGHPSDIEMILEFHEKANGVPEAFLYGDISGHKQIQYEWLKNKQHGNSPVTYTLKLDALNGVQAIDMTPTKGSNWVVNGKPNYDLQIHSDMNQPNVPARDELVGSSGSNVPQWQTSQVSQDPHPDWSYDRFKAFVRMKNAPTFRVERSFIPLFPYIGIHYGQPDWFSSNPNPFYFDTKIFKFVEEPIVGFQEGGIYQLNSVASSPNVDFESPFAFYNFNPNTRFAQLVVRAQNYTANDPYFDYPTQKTLQTYRYSWSMGSSGIWNYGLTVGGFRDFPEKIRIGDSIVNGVSPEKLPQWTMNHAWGTITLDQAMNGYSGSEGIYFYSVQSPLMWQWMLGYFDQAPRYLANPKLPNEVELDTLSTVSVPLGFRDEYSAAYSHVPMLYASPIDHLMHLEWASGGVYHFSRTRILRTSNLDGGKYINYWDLETIPTAKKPPKVLEQIATVDGYVMYSGSHGVTMRKSNVSQSIMMIKPPTDKASWKSYVSKVRLYQRGNNPEQMYNWISSVAGPTLRIGNATFQKLEAGHNGFSFELDIFKGYSGLSKIQGLPTKQGKYMVTYRVASRKWSYVPAQAAKLKSKVTVVGAPKIGQLSKYVMSIHNEGTVPWTGIVTAYAGQMMMYEQQLTIQGGQTWHTTVGWTPEDFGNIHVGIRSGDKILFDQVQPVSNDTKLRYDFLFHPGATANVVNGLLIAFMLGLVIVTFSFLRKLLRKEESHQ